MISDATDDCISFSSSAKERSRKSLLACSAAASADTVGAMSDRAERGRANPGVSDEKVAVELSAFKDSGKRAPNPLGWAVADRRIASCEGRTTEMRLGEGWAA